MNSVYMLGNVVSQNQNCFVRKTNGLIYQYKVVIAIHLMDIPSWPLVKWEEVETID